MLCKSLIFSYINTSLVKGNFILIPLRRERDGKHGNLTLKGKFKEKILFTQKKQIINVFI